MITAGTLLGAVRGKGHIPHETDIDIQIRRDDSDTVKRLIGAALNETHFVFAAGTPLRLFFSKTNLVHIDIWLYSIEANNAIREVMMKEGAGLQHYLVNYDTIFPLSKCEYNGSLYPCARERERYLELRYGKDWKIPKKKYSPNPEYKDGDDSGFLIGKGVTQRIGNRWHSCPVPNYSDPNVSQEITNTFFEIVQLLNDVKCPYFITAGSLLGFVRECRLWSDLDFAIPLGWWNSSENRNALEQAMVQSGYQSRWGALPHFGTPGKFGFEQAWKKGEVGIDFFSVVNVDENNIFLWSLWINNKLYPCSVQYVGVKEFLWGNITVRAPIPFDSVLRSYYGNKWRESFLGTWQWDQHPFTIGSCTKNSSKIESLLEKF